MFVSCIFRLHFWGEMEVEVTLSVQMDLIQWGLSWFYEHRRDTLTVSIGSGRSRGWALSACKGLSQPLWPQGAYLQVKGSDQIKSEILKLHLIICISKSEDTPY